MTRKPSKRHLKHKTLAKRRRKYHRLINATIRLAWRNGLVEINNRTAGMMMDYLAPFSIQIVAVIIQNSLRGETHAGPTH